MAETPNRRAASAAAREFLHTKVDRIGDLAEAARTVDAAVEARAAADRHITDSQQAYGRTRRAAIAAGWTDEELSQLGWVAQRGPQRQRPVRAIRAHRRDRWNKSSSSVPAPIDRDRPGASELRVGQQVVTGHSRRHLDRGGAPPQVPSPVQRLLSGRVSSSGRSAATVRN